MISLDRWQEIYGTIRRNKLRTVLTALSVAWGIFMLVLLLGAGAGLQNNAEHKFRDDAVNSIWIFAGKTSMPFSGLPPGREVRFTNADYDAIKREIAGVEYITSRFYLRGGDYAISYKDRASSFQVRSCHPDHQYLENSIIIEGRFLNDLDISEYRKVTVIGTAVRDFLFKGEPALGKDVDIGGISYTVVGIFADDGNEGELEKVYIPISTAQRAYGGADRVHQIMFTLGSATVADSKRVEQEVRDLLAARHRIHPDDKRAIRFRNNLETFAEITEVFQLIQYFVWIVGLGTIIAGIVGVSNIMLISVKERTREIGIRKALGATPGSLVALIVEEAVFLTMMAGYCGVVAGVGALELASRALGENDYVRDPQVDLGVVLAATALLVFFGALAGYFPARRAARINPIEALRDE